MSVTTTHLPAYQTLLDRVAELEERCERLARVVEASKRLMLLKRHRGIRGKDKHYTEMKPVAWQELHNSLQHIDLADLDPPPGERSA